MKAAKNNMSKRFFSYLFVSCALLFLASFSHSSNIDTPQQVVRKTADTLLEVLRDEKIEPNTAKQQLTAIVDTILSPVIDFRRVAYRTMAKHYKQASTQQFLVFTEAIKQSLINTYANPLVESNSQALAEKLSVEIRETKIVEGKTPRAIVSTWLRVGNNDKYDVIYYFYFNTSKNAWLIENMVIEGINLLITFRSQYQRLISENRGDINKVTQVWAQSKTSE